MKFRWKLLILLLSVAVIPPLVLWIFGSRHLRLLEKKLVAQVRLSREQDASDRLQFVIDSHTVLIREELEQAEMILKTQRLAIQRCLARTAAAVSEATDVANSRQDPSYSSSAAQVFKILPGADKPAATADIARLSEMSAVYRPLAAPLVIRHQTLLSNGLFCAYPGRVSVPDNWNPQGQPWYRQALAKDCDPWTEGYRDPLSGRVVVAAALPIMRTDGTRIGVTAVIISVRRLLSRHSVLQHTPPQTRAFLVRLCSNGPAGSTQGLKIIAAQESGKNDMMPNASQLEGRGLTSSDSKQLQALVAELEDYSITTCHMPYRGCDSLWAGGTILYPYGLVLITPHKVIQQPIESTENLIGQLMQDQFQFSLVLLLATILAAILLTVLFSRTVTRPLQALMRGIRQRSAGRLDSRVDIDSRDEFGDLARVFNNMGPLLEEHVRLEHSLALAMEVQRNLLPAEDPQIEGLDICGRSIFCDQVGGDYYDYLLADPHGTGKLGVVIGDVSGHGVPAALLMSTIRALLHQRSAFPGCMHCDLSDINQQLFRDIGDSGRFVTLLYAAFDVRDKTVRWVRAGHDPTLVYDLYSDTFDELGGRGIALGVLETAFFPEYVRDINSGQIFAFGTDGIWETRNFEDEMFGRDRLRQIIRTHASESAKAISDAVVQAVVDFRGGHPQEDDVTLVIVKTEN